MEKREEKLEKRKQEEMVGDSYFYWAWKAVQKILLL